ATEEFRLREGFDYAKATPEVELRLGGTGPDGTSQNLEWQYRVDGGFWSVFQRRPVVTLKNDSFLLQGPHHVEVRGRMQGVPESLDPNPRSVDFVIDTVPPDATLTVEGSRARIIARDAVSPAAELRYEVSDDGGITFAALAGPVFSVDPRSLEGLAVRVS